jgi:hypothetical protein
MSEFAFSLSVAGSLEPHTPGRGSSANRSFDTPMSVGSGWECATAGKQALDVRVAHAHLLPVLRATEHSSGHTRSIDEKRAYIRG